MICDAQRMFAISILYITDATVLGTAGQQQRQCIQYAVTKLRLHVLQTFLALFENCFIFCLA